MLISEFQVRIDFELAIVNPVDDELLATSLDAAINAALDSWVAQRRCLCSLPKVTLRRQPKEAA
jgi:hypothetical protein